jgi:hypothetical protein
MDHVENDAPNNSSIVVCVFVDAVTFSRILCLATTGGYTYRNIDMKYAVEMGSGATVHVPCSIKTGSGIQKLTWGDSQAHRYTDSMEIA